MINSAFALLLAASASAAPLCPPGHYTRPEGGGAKCSPCVPPGSVSAADAEGWTICVGGAPDKGWCPAGTGTVINHRGRIIMWYCLPCTEETQSVVYSDRVVWRECVPRRCPVGEVPIHRAGPVLIYDCVKPQKGQSIDMVKVLPPGDGSWAGAVPRCGAGSGLSLDPDTLKLRCESCAEGEDVLRRVGRPICGFSKPGMPPRWKDSCGEHKVPLHGGRCVSCPKGSHISLESLGVTQCLPD
jgi:hypothetical protein